MPLYMFQVSYTGDSWKYQVEAREDPRERISQLAAAVGGQLRDVFYAFGDYDLVVLLEMPNDEAMAGHVLAALAGGSMKATKVTPLLTVEQGLKTMEVASKAREGYHPPVTS